MTVIEERKLIRDTQITPADVARIMKLLGLQNSNLTSEMYAMVKAIKYYQNKIEPIPNL